MDLTIERTLDLDFDAAIEKATAALATEGFGIMTTIDVQAKMKEKLDREMAPYFILGACAPPLAWEAVHAVPEVGVLLPCNVVVSVEDGQTVVRAMEPRTAMEFFDNDAIQSVAADASDRLRRAIAAI